MVIKVEEIELSSLFLFEPTAYPTGGFYKVVWVDQNNKPQDRALVYVTKDNKNDRLDKVRYISPWDQIEPFIFDDLVVVAKDTNTMLNELNNECVKEIKPGPAVPTPGIKLQERTKAIELLELYSKFLEEHGYTDTDWRAESPYAIDEFLKNNYD